MDLATAKTVTGGLLLGFSLIIIGALLCFVFIMLKKRDKSPEPKRMNKSGFITAIITARNNGTVAHRAKNLNFTEVYQGRQYKLPALEELIEKYNLTYENVSYMGDDLPDICILEKVGLACCPADAVKEVLEICNFKSTINGGRGAVRELCDFILDAQGIEKQYIVSEGANR